MFSFNLRFNWSVNWVRYLHLGLILLSPLAWSKPMSSLQWLDKTARTLRAGQGLSPSDPVHRWLKMERTQVVDEMLADPRFAEATLKFGMFFSGTNPEILYKGNRTSRYGLDVIERPNVVASALQILNNESNFLTLIDLKQNYAYLGGLRNPSKLSHQKGPLNDAQIREGIFDHFISEIQGMLEIAQQGNTRQQFCPIFRTNQALFNPQMMAQKLGLPRPWILLLHEWTWDFTQICGNQGKKFDAVKAIRERIERLRALRRFIRQTVDSAYPIQSLDQLQKIAIEDIGISSTYNSFSGTLFRDIPNSSTNFNRKRAEYVLRRYFCEDLVPVPLVETPSQNPKPHGSDEHVNEPKCRSCHYKLDPLAGFFRTIGNRGINFAGMKTIVFDDFARMPLTQYIDNWKDQSVPGGWNIGYIRSDTDLDKNTYMAPGMDLADLIATAPEVKSCVARRIFEFVLGEVEVDWAYRRHHTDQFIEAAQSNSTQAYKNLVKTLVLSNSFAEFDPQSGVCYDQANHDTNRSTPPCRVASILENHCISCHGPSRQSGGLRVDIWDINKGFHYLKKRRGTEHYSKQEGLKNIMARITATDPDDRMPPDRAPDGGHLPTENRDQLFIWLKNQLGGQE